jgi:Spy/CpxP family protein refolding chaperone
MKRFSQMLLCLVAMLLVSPSFGEDEPAKKAKGKGAKGKTASAAMVEKLAAVELTDEQKSKLAELSTELDGAIATLKEAGFTQELQKKKADAMKKAREEGKKGKGVEAEVLASLNLTAEQQELLKKAGAAQAKFQKGVATILTDEQIAKLPEADQQNLKRAKAPAKKEKAAA